MKSPAGCHDQNELLSISCQLKNGENSVLTLLLAFLNFSVSLE
jgi:hypothetical protein